MKFQIRSERDLPLLILVSAAAVLVLNWSTSPDEPNATERVVRDHYGPALSRAKTNLPELFSSDDYPQQSLRNEEQGTVAFTLSVNPQGRVSACVINQSSGSAALDNATCTILQRRARFTPARDGQGKAVADLATGRIRWVLPD